MSEEQMAAVMREFAGSIGKPDVDKSLTYLAEDATWETAEGVFQGKDQLRRYLGWLAQSFPDLRIVEYGVGIVCQGNRAAFEHTMHGTVENVPCSWLALCAYEFTGDKIQKIRTVHDRLLILKQAAKGIVEETVVNALVKRAEKGLH